MLHLHAFGIRHVALLPDFGLMPADLVRRRLELVAGEVLPRVRLALGRGTGD
jgi:hypothetical protein